MKPRALIRPPSDAYARCLRPDGSGAVDPALARRQHAAYRDALMEWADVVELPAEPDLPDACFVEDAAVLYGNVAVITRPGASSRRAEVASVAKALSALRECRPMTRGTLDGGDAMVLGGRVYVGLSKRTDREGADELARLLGLDLRVVPVGTWLHLKTAVTPFGSSAAIQRRGAYPPGTFPGIEILETGELPGANVLLLGGGVIVSADAPETAALLARRGLAVRTVDISEFHKGDAGLTCLSLILSRPGTA